MTRLLTATILAFSLTGLTAIAQQPGADTTTTPSTNPDIMATPPNMETGGDLLMEDGYEKPDNYFEVEKAERDGLIVTNEISEETADDEDLPDGMPETGAPEIEADINAPED